MKINRENQTRADVEIAHTKIIEVFISKIKSLDAADAQQTMENIMNSCTEKSFTENISIFNAFVEEMASDGE